MNPLDDPDGTFSVLVNDDEQGRHKPPPSNRAVAVARERLVQLLP